jgi:hypothetical protein
MARFKVLLLKFTMNSLVFTLTDYCTNGNCFLHMPHVSHRYIYAMHLKLPPIFQQWFDKVHLF